MKILNDVLLKNKDFCTLLDKIKNYEKNISVTGVFDSQKSHLIYGLSKNLNTTNIIICESELKAKKYYDDLKFFFKNDNKICYYPAKDVVFYSADVKSTDIIKYRFEVIEHILSNKNITIVLPIEALFDRLVSRDIFEEFILDFEVGNVINLKDLSKKLIFMGYEHTELIEGAGQFCIRGGIIDIFSPNLENPFRIELWDDEIDSIRLLDKLSGRSIKNITKVNIFPMRELVYNENNLNYAIENILNEFEKDKEILIKNNKIQELETLSNYIKDIIDKLKNQKTFSGIDKFIQFFYKEEITLLDYIDKNSILYFDEPTRIRQKANFVENEFLESLKGRLLKNEILTAQKNMIFGYEAIMNFANKFININLYNLDSNINSNIVKFNVKSNNILKNDLNNLNKQIEYYKSLNYTMVFLANSTVKCERLEKEFNEQGITTVFLRGNSINYNQDGILYIIRGSLNNGFEYPDNKFLLIADKELFGEEKKSKNLNNSKSKLNKENIINSFNDLKVGDYVVHDNHGIAIFNGLEKIVTDNISKDYLKLGYDDGGILYVSVNQLDIIQKYSLLGNATPKLNKLGSKQWSVAKAKVKKTVQIVAQDLINLYAKRKDSKGFEYSKDNIWQTEFEANFPFLETDDQLNAISDMKKDMESTQVMDRLICGDVGFGKTEVAIRGAFKAVQDNKQVVFLVPTTILAQQHYQTFASRMQDYPINVNVLSRFRTPKQQKQTIEGLAKGSVDIVIGTHRVLSKDICFKDLGLVIVDEEQRFGVKHKEKLKSLRANVDILTLSATPIPRTLHMSMSGIRDLSLLEDPPLERMPVQTYVLEHDLESIKNAINRELSRGGQVYYLHNRVHSIENEVSVLKNIIPDANISFAHGQMSERELEKVMHSFLKNEINVLVCTTIIETGLDISNVNTIIINDADKMGLSQLYQLRGRVGRSNKTSFAYLMYKKDKVLQDVSEKRLQTIKEFTEFGSGFKIARRDLEIRGAGNLLGAEQHGHVDIIGYDMYCKLLDQAILKLSGKQAEDYTETLIDLNISAFISKSYIKNELQKLDMYKKISNIKTNENYLDVADELLDKFGKIPKTVQNLLDIALIKSYANSIGVTKITHSNNKIIIIFKENNIKTNKNLDKNKLKDLLEKNKQFSFDGTLKYDINNSMSKETPSLISNTNSKIQSNIYYKTKFDNNSNNSKENFLEVLKNVFNNLSNY